jgi:hypothetical protein
MILRELNLMQLAASLPSSDATRILTFIDMGGHERCLKTCLWGMTCLLPDYALLCISAQEGGMGRMSREHLAVAVALEVGILNRAPMYLKCVREKLHVLCVNQSSSCCIGTRGCGPDQMRSC